MGTKGKRFIEGFSKGVFSKVAVRTLIEFLCPIVISVATAFISNNILLALCLGIPFLIIYVSFMVIYKKLDSYNLKKHEREMQDRQKLLQEIKRYETKQKSYIDILKSIQSVLMTTSKNINSLEHKIAEENVLDEEIWSFKQTCAIICSDAYNVLKSINERCSNVEITYINFERTKEGTIAELIAYKNSEDIMPSILEKRIAIPKTVPKKKLGNKYSFERYYLAQRNEPQIFVNEEIIKKNFYFKDEIAKNECKYKQFVAIPVSCESKKVIGIIQIASLVEKAFGETVEELQETILSLMKPLGYLFLLANKTQKCIHTLVEVKNEN